MTWIRAFLLKPCTLRSGIEEVGCSQLSVLIDLGLPTPFQVCDRDPPLEVLVEVGPSEDDLDGKVAEFVFVGRGGPGKVFAMGGDNRLDQCERGGIGPIPIQVGEVNLKPVTVRSRPLVEGGLKMGGPQGKALKPGSGKVIDYAFHLEIGSSPELERGGRSSPFGEVGPFKNHLAWIDQGGFRFRQVRGGGNPM